MIFGWAEEVAMKVRAKSAHPKGLLPHIDRWRRSVAHAKVLREGAIGRFCSVTAHRPLAAKCRPREGAAGGCYREGAIGRVLSGGCYREGAIGRVLSGGSVREGAIGRFCSGGCYREVLFVVHARVLREGAIGRFCSTGGCYREVLFVGRLPWLSGGCLRLGCREVAFALVVGRLPSQVVAFG
jgi:ribosomal protein L24E